MPERVRRHQEEAGEESKNGNSSRKTPARVKPKARRPRKKVQQTEVLAKKEENDKAIEEKISRRQPRRRVKEPVNSRPRIVNRKEKQEETEELIKKEEETEEIVKKEEETEEIIKKEENEPLTRGTRSCKVEHSPVKDKTEEITKKEEQKPLVKTEPSDEIKATVVGKEAETVKDKDTYETYYDSKSDEEWISVGQVSKDGCVSEEKKENRREKSKKDLGKAEKVESKIKGERPMVGLKTSDSKQAPIYKPTTEELIAMSLSEYKDSLNWQRYLQAHKVVRYKNPSRAMVKAVQEMCMKSIYVRGDPKTSLRSRTFRTEDPLDENRPDEVNAMIIHPNRIFQHNPELLKYVTRLYLKNVWYLGSTLISTIKPKMARNQLYSLYIHDIDETAEKLGAQFVEYFSGGLEELYTNMETEEMRVAIGKCRKLRVLSLLEFDIIGLEWLLDDILARAKIQHLRFKVPLTKSQAKTLIRYAPMYVESVTFDFSIEEGGNQIFESFGPSIHSYNTIDDAPVGRSILEAVNLTEVDMIISYDQFLPLVSEIYCPETTMDCLSVLRFHLISENIEYPSRLCEGINRIAEHALLTWQLAVFELTCSVPSQIAEELVIDFNTLWSFTPSLQEVHLNLSMEDKRKDWGDILSNIAFDVATTYGVNDVFINQNKDVTPRLSREARHRLINHWNDWQGYKAQNFVIDRKLITSPSMYWMQ